MKSANRESFPLQPEVLKIFQLSKPESTCLQFAIYKSKSVQTKQNRRFSQWKI